MIELVRTNDAVFLSWLMAVLEDAGIKAFVFDQFTSAIEGSIGALPRRVMVHQNDFNIARRIMEAQGAEVAP